MHLFQHSARMRQTELLRTCAWKLSEINVSSLPFWGRNRCGALRLPCGRIGLQYLLSVERDQFLKSDRVEIIATVSRTDIRRCTQIDLSQSSLTTFPLYPCQQRNPHQLSRATKRASAD